MFLLPVARWSPGRFLHMPVESPCPCLVPGWALGGLVYWMRLHMGTCQPQLLTFLCQGLCAMPMSCRNCPQTHLRAAVHIIDPEVSLPVSPEVCSLLEKQNFSHLVVGQALGHLPWGAQEPRLELSALPRYSTSTISASLPACGQ